MVSNTVWVTWEKQVRNRTLSACFGAELHEIVPTGRKRLSRYVVCSWTTLKLLWNWRRKRVIVQNPSIVLALLAVAIKPLFQYQLIVDTHNAPLQPCHAGFLRVIVSFLEQTVIRLSDYTVVSNSDLGRLVADRGGSCLVIPDPLPMHLCNVGGSVGEDERLALRKDALGVVAFVCTWANDEPFQEVFLAAARLAAVRFFVTGNSRGQEKNLGFDIPTNVTLLGYVPDEQYVDLLRKVDVIVDLTTRESCLVCGAYEAVALEKPFVISDTKVLREYFPLGGVHVENHASNIVAGIQQVLDGLTRYRADVRVLKRKIQSEWPRDFERVTQELERGRA
ncbi:MAG: hypothetical protein CALGDGBN_00690 [Pseudomonadales bacterium]|nr:hypothetical protein [Pseudomonadales bacterium]